MRKIVQVMSVSLDGFYEGEDADISWHRVDEELHQYFNDRLRTADAFLDGRITHQLMADFWPTADQDPDTSPQMAEFAGIWREMPKYLYSTTLRTADWNTTVVPRVDPDEVRALKAGGDGELVLGGARLGDTFRRLGLIDVYRVYVHPVLVGRGTPFFNPDGATPAPPPADLRLTGTRTFGNGVVELCHEVTATAL
ncbi:dihydrofolate reductase family protein [Streptomyces sp. NPDC058045]|uniref:dihydrofolate reductase family protein n=1 Tax=Streptomyces sp. NPDC058045 TaxID=3346311 RepID=UPI0036F02A4C